jgi:hypothetical protein
VQGISGTASTAKQVSVKLADCNDEYPTLKSVRPLAEPGFTPKAVLEKLVTIQMLAVLVTHHRWPLFDFTGAGTPSTPQDGGLICWIRSRSDRVLPEWWAVE